MFSVVEISLFSSFQFCDVYSNCHYWVKNNNYNNLNPYESQQFEPFKYIMRRVYTHVFYLMSEKQAFSLQNDCYNVNVFLDYRPPYWWTTWCLYTKLYKVASNVSANNSETMYRTDLRNGEVVKIFVSYNIPSS